MSSAYIVSLFISSWLHVLGIRSNPKWKLKKYIDERFNTTIDLQSISISIALQKYIARVYAISSTQTKKPQKIYEITWFGKFLTLLDLLYSFSSFITCNENWQICVLAAIAFL